MVGGDGGLNIVHIVRHDVSVGRDGERPRFSSFPASLVTAGGGELVAAGEFVVASCPNAWPMNSTRIGRHRLNDSDRFHPPSAIVRATSTPPNMTITTPNTHGDRPTLRP